MRLTAAKCKTISPALRHLSDEEVLALRDALYSLAEVAVDAFMDDKSVPNNPMGIHASTKNDDNTYV